MPFDGDETHLNDDEPLILLKNLTERRSGLLDRRDSAADFRAEVQREERKKLDCLFHEIAEKDIEIAELKREIANILEWQKTKEAVLNAADQIVSAGAVFTWCIKLIIGGTMLIGGLAGTHEIIKRWTQ
jgi:hypothetical protein